MTKRIRRSQPNVPTGTFRDALAPNAPAAPKLKSASRPTPPRASSASKPASKPATDGWEHEDSDVYQLLLPAGEMTGEVFTDIEAALLAATEQLQRTPSSPELPPIADRHRRATS